MDAAHPASQLALARLIFLSRWLQAPLHLGLIVAQSVYGSSKESKVMLLQVVIHLTFVLSAVALAGSGRIVYRKDEAPAPA